MEEESGAFRKGERKLGAGGSPGEWGACLSGQGPVGHVKDFVLFPEVVRSHCSVFSRGVTRFDLCLAKPFWIQCGQLLKRTRLEAKRPVRKLECLSDLGQWPWMEAERNGWKLRDTCGVNSTARRDK